MSSDAGDVRVEASAQREGKTFPGTKSRVGRPRKRAGQARETPKEAKAEEPSGIRPDGLAIQIDVRRRRGIRQRRPG